MTEDNISLLQKARSGDQQALEQLVENNTGLIWSVARRFFGRGYEPDDLFQLGSVGFLKAVQGFDLSYGTQFSTYAVPKITGEILRFLRDDSMVKVSRGLKERAAKIRQTRESWSRSWAGNRRSARLRRKRNGAGGDRCSGNCDRICTISAGDRRRDGFFTGADRERQQRGANAGICGAAAGGWNADAS